MTKKLAANQQRRQKKYEAILESARKVFSKKGFIDVTMKDIIEECGISRGGIYLYFSSVEEIFMETVKQRNNRKFDDIRQDITNNVPFAELFDNYLAGHRERLLNSIEDGMSRAMYEYYFTHKSEADRKFQKAQMTATKSTIQAILELGVHQQALQAVPVAVLAENFMLLIEGLGILALTGEISTEVVENQFGIMRTLLGDIAYNEA